MLINDYSIPFFFRLTLFLMLSSIACIEVGASESDKLNEGETDWVLGLGMGVFDYQLYPGAKATNRLYLPAPYFTFRSPELEIDRGIRGFLYNSENIAIDISADFALPVNSDDTQARKGMPDLDFMLQLGPSIEFLLNDNSKNYFDVRFELPLRVAVVSDFNSVENIGYLIEPRFSFNHRRLSKTGFSQKAVIGLKFSTQDLHAYYYDVAAEFATEKRPVYNSDAGFGGGFIKYGFSYKARDFIYWAFLRYQSLRGAEFEDSPLVLKKDYYFIGFGFAWIFAGSL